MSFLFCSWATNDDGKKDLEAEEEDAELNESKNYFLEKSLDTIEKPPENGKTITTSPIKNGDLSTEELKKDEPVLEEKKPFFVMWNTQEEEVEEEEETSDHHEENGNDQTTENSNLEETIPVSPVKTKKSQNEENFQESKSSSLVEDKPMFFAVWKDPNKEDEYISSSSSSEEEEDEEEDQRAVTENGHEEEKTESCDTRKQNDQDDTDDIFNKIASSVSKSMTTIFCDNEDFEIKQSFSDDNDFDNTGLGFEEHGIDPSGPGSLSSGKRSRSGSLMSSKSFTDSDREGVRKSMRDKRPKKKFDLLFTEPKPLSKYFEPGSFIDKSLYKTHRCDVKIRKFKIPGHDLEKLLPPSKKRKIDDDELPLSKRKKLPKAKTETRRPIKPRTTNSITKREEAGTYQGVCKYVSKQCPLCWNFWNVSQPYGLHVYNQTCQKGDCTSSLGDSTIDFKEKAFLSVHTANNQTDSYVSTSNIPSLKLLCRKNLHGKNSTSDVAISVKEGLEYYHSLVMPGNVNEHVLFRKLSQMAKITIVSSVRQYERLCRDPLKVAIYLEKKISRARAKHGAKHLSTYKWVDKYNYFLKLPLHDLYLNISKDDGFRVLEVPDTGAIKLLCLVCSSMSCNGCLPIKEKPRKLLGLSDPSKQLKKNKKHKKKKSADKKGASKSPSIPHLKLVKCKSCGKYLKNLAALKSHAKVCQPGSKKQKNKHRSSK